MFPYAFDVRRDHRAAATEDEFPAAGVHDGIAPVARIVSLVSRIDLDFLQFGTLAESIVPDVEHGGGDGDRPQSRAPVEGMGADAPDAFADDDATPQPLT